MIDGGLYIGYNPVLTSLSGLDNVDADSVTDLFIVMNGNLSTCAVQSICDYLAAPNGSVSIYGNASGCDSLEEVESACAVGVDRSAVGGRQSAVRIYPNPSTGPFTFAFNLENPSRVNLEVMNRLGQVVEVITNEYLPQGEQQIIWYKEGLPAGIYFYRLTASGQRKQANGKLVVVR
jgi:hypothetical protein